MKVVESDIRRTNPWTFALYVGFFAGLIWGAVKIVLYSLRFTSVLPGFMVEPLFKHEFMKSWRGLLTGWAFIIAASIAAALLYTAVLRKVKGPYPGILYGAAWWLVSFLLAGEGGVTPAIAEMNPTTLVSELCLFVLWGLFIGYTISEEFNEERHSPADNG